MPEDKEVNDQTTGDDQTGKLKVPEEPAENVDEETHPGNEETPAGDEETSPGNEETPAGDEETSPGNEETPAGDEETSPGNEETPAGSEEAPPDNEKKDTAKKDSNPPVNAASDQYKESTVTAAVNTSAPGKARKAEESENEFFDSLPLKGTEAVDEGGEAGNGILKQKIETLRKGNLYKSVLVARLLKDKKKNPLASGGGVRVSRFLDSSALDTAADINTIAGNGVGLLNTLDSNSSAKSVWQAMSLVTNLLTIVSTCRNMAVKIRKLYVFWKKHKAQEKVSKIDTALTLLGLVSDTLTIMVKGVAMAKSIVSLAGKNNRILDMISNAMFLLTGTTQIIGALNGVRGLETGYKGLKALKRNTERPRDEAMYVVEKKNNLTEGVTKSWSESKRIEAVKDLLMGKEDEDQEEGKQQNQEKQNTPKSRKKRLSAEEKDKLILYLGMTKRIDKMERSLAVTATTLVNLVIGFASTGVSGASTIVNREEVQNSALKNAATGMGAVANASNILATSAKIANRAGNAQGGRRGMVKQRLWEKVLSLTQNRHGLKWLDHSLAKPPEEQKKLEGKTTEEAASETVDLYHKTDGQFKAMGVPYAKLLRADSLSKFQDMLVDSL